MGAHFLYNITGWLHQPIYGYMFSMQTRSLLWQQQESSSHQSSLSKNGGAIYTLIYIHLWYSWKKWYSAGVRIHTNAGVIIFSPGFQTHNLIDRQPDICAPPDAQEKQKSQILKIILLWSEFFFSFQLLLKPKIISLSFHLFPPQRCSELLFVFSAQPASSECTSHFGNVGWGGDHMGWTPEDDAPRRAEGIPCGVLGCLPRWR